MQRERSWILHGTSTNDKIVELECRIAWQCRVVMIVKQVKGAYVASDSQPTLEWHQVVGAACDYYRQSVFSGNRNERLLDREARLTVSDLWHPFFVAEVRCKQGNSPLADRLGLIDIALEAANELQQQDIDHLSALLSEKEMTEFSVNLNVVNRLTLQNFLRMLARATEVAQNVESTTHAKPSKASTKAKPAKKLTAPLEVVPGGKQDDSSVVDQPRAAES